MTALSRSFSLVSFIKRLPFFADSHVQTRQTWQFFLSIVVVLGVAARMIFPGSFPFGFDQVQISQAADEITKGNMTLIGPRTGPAAMFTGPLIYYLTALFAFFLPTEVALIVTTGFIALITALMLWLLASRYTNKNISAVVLVIWAFSPFLVALDRVPWNPNLSLVAAALTFFPLLKKERSWKWADVGLLSAGVFLGYQAHFSGLFLLPLVVVSVILFHKEKIWPIVGALAGFLLTLVPTFIFDLRNGWLNARGLLSLFSNTEQFSSHQAFSRIGHMFFIIIETLGKLLFENAHLVLIMVSGFIFLGTYIFLSERSKQSGPTTLSFDWKLVVLWFLFVGGSFSLYRESTPEYYFLILVPSMLVLMAWVITTALSARQQFFVLLFFAIYGITDCVVRYQTPHGLPLGKQWETVAFLRATQATGGVSSVAFDMEAIESLGLSYLLQKENFAFDEKGKVVHVISPTYATQFITKRLSDSAALWVDSRTPTGGSQYHATDSYMIAYPPEAVLYELRSDDDVLNAQTVYLIKVDGRKNPQAVDHWLYLFGKKQNPEAFQSLLEFHATGQEYTQISTTTGKQTVRVLALRDDVFFVTTVQSEVSLDILFP